MEWILGDISGHENEEDELLEAGPNFQKSNAHPGMEHARFLL